ncbi:MAG TPA: hypothetical protein VHC69_08615 [Polyangiaceae bacterium]|nr:hypothetical protein [Polyangiaceae bacterium]
MSKQTNQPRPVAFASPLARLFINVAAVAVISLCGCQRRAPEPETHPTAPATSSEPPPAAFLAPSSPHEHLTAPAAESAKGQLKWSDPPGWTRLSQSSPMRLATYRVPHAGADKDDGELAVFHFGGGQGGDVEANLKRWENQFSDKKGEPKRTDRTVNGLKAHVLEVDSGTYAAMAMMPGQSSTPKSDYGMLAAVVETPLGPYFFKLTGPSKTVKAQKDAYMTLLDSVKVEG